MLFSFCTLKNENISTKVWLCEIVSQFSALSLERQCSTLVKSWLYRQIAWITPTSTLYCLCDFSCSISLCPSLLIYKLGLLILSTSLIIKGLN